MRGRRLTARRAAVLASLVLLIVGALALTVLVSIWFLAPVPVLAAAAYATVLGMTPGRFADALDTDGTGPPFPV